MSNFTLPESSLAANVSTNDSMINTGEHSLVQQRSLGVIFLYLLTIVIGVPGNVLIIVVFWTKPRKTTTAGLIVALAVSDLVSCLARIPDAVFAAIQLGGSPPSFTAFLVITLVNNLSLTVAVELTALIAFDRYDCVCRHNKRLLTRSRSRLAIALICCFSMISNIPLFLYVLGHQSMFMLSLAKQVIFYLVDVLVVMICYGKVYATIRRHVRVGVTRKRAGQPGISDSLDGRLTDGSMPTGLPSRTEGDPHGALNPIDQDRSTVSTLTMTVPSHQNQAPIGVAVTPGQCGTTGPLGVRQRVQAPALAGPAPTDMQRKTTRMLFFVTLIFLVTYIPYWIYVGFLLSGRPRDVILDVVYNLLNLLFINNAVNPLIYGLANRRFRKDTRDILRKLCRRDPTSVEQ